MYVCGMWRLTLVTLLELGSNQINEHKQTLQQAKTRSVC